MKETKNSKMWPYGLNVVHRNGSDVKTRNYIGRQNDVYLAGNFI
jgi:hypothetical protein